MESQSTEVIAIFDVGKTNKKVLVFDRHYQVLEEHLVQLPSRRDEEGDACEDLAALTSWIRDEFNRLTTQYGVRLKAVNFAGYGASWVHLDEKGQAVFPLYDYLKPMPAGLQEDVYRMFGGQQAFCRSTASPALGNLNSGFQLLRLQRQYPDLFAKVQYSLHLPQFLSWLITGKAFSNITSIGCHTSLWDFERQTYHAWVQAFHADKTLAPLTGTSEVTPLKSGGHAVFAGVGIHDSSAALIPYLTGGYEPFVLLSTGTWSISLNPFNREPLTDQQLTNDCLCYMDYHGNPVKASRLFAGREHDELVNVLAERFHVQQEFFRSIAFDPRWISGNSASAAEAYHQLIHDLVIRQEESTRYVLEEGSTIRKLFVDGGFGRNQVYMNFLARAFKGWEVAAASVPQATALGAAMAIHAHWNSTAIPEGLVGLQLYHPQSE